ncbi:MAG TPA: YqaJ viral recombinase family protein [Candidatus Scybalomonas excrementigallinarum]|nr:YqaJ viral recombinase family protein [Candidatus Scybalomonas excrementigallinarum]
MLKKIEISTLAVPDIPIIMGISPFKTRYELLLEKAGLKEIEEVDNEYTRYGNVMEPKIREYINKKYKINFIEGKHIIDDIRCHTDGEDDNNVLEIKTTSKIYDNVSDYKIYLVQLLFYMQCTNKNNGWLAVYERTDDFNEEFDKSKLNVYSIFREEYENLLEQINQSVEQFRIDLSKLKENPFLTEEELMPIDLTSISNKIIALEERLQEYKKIEQEQKELKEKLKEMMKEKNVKKWETPSGVKITLVEDGEDKLVRKFNEKLFKDNNLDLWDEYSEEVVQKGKSGYVKITLPKN